MEDIKLTVRSYTNWRCYDPDDLYEPIDEEELSEPEVYDGADAITALFKKMEDDLWQFDGDAYNLRAPGRVIISYKGQDVEADLEDSPVTVEELIGMWESAKK